MSDIREYLGWILGSAFAGIGTFLSWFYESGLFAAVAGVIVGAGITYFVQTRTQKRIWKREYLIKITEQVYGELFGNIRGEISRLQDRYYRNIQFSKWIQIQSDHRYFKDDSVFREKLDSFSLLLNT